MMYSIFLVLIEIGAMLGESGGDVVKKMEISLVESLGSYRDNATTPQEMAVKDTWNQIQFEVLFSLSPNVRLND